eukprot:UN01781
MKYVRTHPEELLASFLDFTLFLGLKARKLSFEENGNNQKCFGEKFSNR